VNDVFILPSQYILNRWTKYAKRGYCIKKQGTEQESLKTHAARISRKATSVALKCSLSKELLDDLEKAIDKLDSEADNSLNKLQEQSNEVPLVSVDCATDTLNGVISFRVPLEVKGAKNKRGTISFEKNTGKKQKKSAKNKGIDTTNSSIFFFIICLYSNFIVFTIGKDSNNAAENSYESADPEQFIVRHLTWTTSTFYMLFASIQFCE